ncbi:MAG: hypothetical protein GX476_05175, partial [Firmicutes bacterium]|nr:hypothetical protein [Bacillota bacterium]
MCVGLYSRGASVVIRLNDYSQRQIADFLELPLTTVKKRLYDSRKRLKEYLRE